MNGQHQRLQLPTGPTFDFIRHQLSKLSNFDYFFAVRFNVGKMNFTASCLHGESDTPSLAMATAALREAETMRELLQITGETNELKQPSRWTTPTHTSLDISNPLLMFPINPQNPDVWKYQLAQIHLLMGDYQTGAKLWRHRPVHRGQRAVISPESGLGDTLFYLRWFQHTYGHDGYPPLELQEKLQPIIPVSQHSEARDGIPCGDMFDGSIQPSLRLEASEKALERVGKQLESMGPAPYTVLTLKAGTAFDKQHGGMWQQYKEFPEHMMFSDERFTGTTVFTHPVIYESACRINVWDNLDDALALMEIADTYLGVSNTNTHLRAAVGKTQHVLIPWMPHWYWGLGDSARGGVGGESPFFPGFPTYRQQPNGSWDAAVLALETALRKEQVIA